MFLGFGSVYLQRESLRCVSDVGLTIFKSFTPWSTEATTCSVFVSDIVQVLRVVRGI